MARTRAIIVVSVVAAVAWVTPGVAHAVLTWFGPPPADGPGPLAPLLLVAPETIPVWAWHSVAPWPGVLSLLSTLALASMAAAAAAVVLDRMPAAQGWQVALVVWAAVIGAGVLVAGVQALATIVDDAPFIRLTYFADRGGAAILLGVQWGLLWGWIPALVASRVTHGESRRWRTTLVSGAAIAVAAMLALVWAYPVATDANYAATGQYTANGVQPAPTQPTVAPTPPPLVAPGEFDIDPVWCTADQLEFSGDGGDAATGHRAAAIRAENVGETPCVLAGYPDLAFADPSGNAVAVTVAPGGGFMTEDPGPVPLELQPGGTAVAYAAWDATDGRTVLDAIYVAPYAGARRVVITVVHAWDLTEATQMTVTAWQAPPEQDPYSE